MSETAPRELAVLDQACRLLADAKSLDQIKSIRDQAEAVRTYARAARLGLEVQNQAAQVKLLAERKAGNFLASLKLRGGDRKSKSRASTLKLDDLGISKYQSSQWQRIAAVDEREFCRYLSGAKDSAVELTSEGLLRTARKTRRSSGHGRSDISLSVEEAGGRTDLIDAELNAHELVRDLQDHWEHLIKLLQPLSSSGDLSLRPVERHFIARSLVEVNELISELARMWPMSDSSHGPKYPRIRTL